MMRNLIVCSDGTCNTSDQEVEGVPMGQALNALCRALDEIKAAVLYCAVSSITCEAKLLTRRGFANQFANEMYGIGKTQPVLGGIKVDCRPNWIKRLDIN